ERAQGPWEHSLPTRVRSPAPSTATIWSASPPPRGKNRRLPHTCASCSRSPPVRSPTGRKRSSARAPARPWSASWISTALAREAGKSVAVRITSAGRDVTLEVARRLVERGHLDVEGDIFYLERSELAGVLLGEVRPETLRELVRRRRERAAAWEALDPPAVIC